MKNPYIKLFFSSFKAQLLCCLVLFDCDARVHIQHHKQFGIYFPKREYKKKKKMKSVHSLLSVVLFISRFCLFSLKITQQYFPTLLYIDRHHQHHCVCNKVLRISFFVTSWINYVNHGNENYNVYYVTHITHLHNINHRSITNDSIKPFMCVMCRFKFIRLFKTWHNFKKVISMNLIKHRSIRKMLI